MNAKEAQKKTIEIHESKKGIVYINSKEICEFRNELVKQYKEKLREDFLEHTVEVFGDDS